MESVHILGTDCELVRPLTFICCFKDIFSFYKDHLSNEIMCVDVRYPSSFQK